MQLADYKKFAGDDASRERTLQIEGIAKDLLKRFSEYDGNPDNESLALASKFLRNVELWKQLGQGSRAIYAEQNAPLDIWNCLMYVKDAKTDAEAFGYVMRLKGFGRNGKAKQASAVLRFIDPCRWGTVDWRNAAMIAFYERNANDPDIAVEEAKKENWRKYKELYDYMDQKIASYYQEKYRDYVCGRLPRAADVDLAFWGMSIIAWPLGKRPCSSQAI